MEMNLSSSATEYGIRQQRTLALANPDMNDLATQFFRRATRNDSSTIKKR